MSISNDGMAALTALSQRLGPHGWCMPGTPVADLALQPHLTDWRHRYTGRALAMARPQNTAEVADVVHTCAAHGIAIVPQGGNTGLVGGSVPDSSGTQLILNLQRMQRIRHVDVNNFSLVADAGCTLEAVQTAAQENGMLFPLSLASEGSCTIGGNLATNAGGTQVLRYGTARELCLGLEVVMANGDVWNGLSSLRKDNSGYALRDLLIGSEGTLGIITAASLRLYPPPAGKSTAMLTCQSASDAVACLSYLRRRVDTGLVAFELMGQYALQLLLKHKRDTAAPLHPLMAPNSELPPAWTVLIEITSHDSQTDADCRLQDGLSWLLSEQLAQDAVVACNEIQAKAMWHMRECIPMAEKIEGTMVKHDIAMPTSAIAAFLASIEPVLHAHWPSAKVVCFGHLGDGNLHFNLQPPTDGDSISFADFEPAVNQLVFEEVKSQGGSISAEHGIGQLRASSLPSYKCPTAIQLMRQIKLALDPQGILNPGRLLTNAP